jgi:hypothetical protein
VSAGDRPDLTFHLTPQSAAYWRGWTERLGALVVGRRLFDLTDGWGGTHPLGVPVVVVTHQPRADRPHAGPGTDGTGTVRLGDPTASVQGDRVTHLRFPVRR